MAVVKNLMVRAGADFSGLKKEMEKAQRTVQEFKTNISNSMKALGAVLATIGIGKLIKDSVSSAMEVEAAIQQIKRIMGESSNMFLKWANDSAIAFNLSKQEAIKYGAIYGNLVSSFSKSTAEAMKYTQDLLKASSVIASATGRSMEDVMDRIRSGLLGNTEAIEDLGVNVNIAMIQSTDAFKRFANGKSWQQLSFQTQQQIRLMGILEQTSKKYGDTLNNNTASSQAQLIAQLRNVQLSLGQAFLPIYQIILPALTTLAAQLAYAMNIFSQFTQALFGKTVNQAKSQVNSTMQQQKAVTGLGDAYQEAGKKASGALAGFDEINSLSDSSGSGSGAPVAAASPGGDTQNATKGSNDVPEIGKQIQQMANRVKNTFNSLGSLITQNKEIIISALSGILAAFVSFQTLTFLSTVPAILASIGTAMSALASPIAVASGIIGGLVAAFVYLYQTNEDFKDKINSIWSDIANVFQNFWNNSLRPLGDFIINDFIIPIGSAFKTNMLPILIDVFIGASLIFKDFLNLAISIINDLIQVIKLNLALIRTIVIDVLEIIKGLWDKYGQEYISNVRETIKGLQETFKLIWDNIINPILQPALAMMSWLWTEHLSKLVYQVGDFIMKLITGAQEIYNGFIKPIIDSLVVELGPTFANIVAYIVDTFGTFIAGVSDVCTGVIKTLGGLVDFIVGVFTGNWKKAWEGVKEIFGGVFDSLVGLVKVPLNMIIDAINFVLRGLNQISIKVPDWVSKITGISGTWGFSIPTIPKLATGGITNGPMVAMIGDNPGGKEVVSPLNDLQDMISSAVGTAVMSAMQFSSNGTKQSDIIIKIDGTTLARVMNPYNSKETNRIGNAMLVTT